LRERREHVDLGEHGRRAPQPRRIGGDRLAQLDKQAILQLLRLLVGRENFSSCSFSSGVM